ncbi:hypothetical protein B566_EDAN007139, partial [Ephemera danica]
MATIPDALADHHMLVSSLGEQDSSIVSLKSSVNTKSGVSLSNEMEKQMESVTYISQDKPTSHGHLLQLEDGTTVFLPSVGPLVNGQAVTLADGSTAIIETEEKIDP